MLRPVQQVLNQLCAFVRCGIIHKYRGFLDGRQGADHIQVHPADKRGIVTQGRRRKLQLLQLVIDVTIHVILLRQVGPPETIHIARKCQQRAFDEMQVTHEHSRLAAPKTRHQTGGADVRHLVVGAFKNRQVSDVTLCAVRIMRQHTELLLPRGMFEHAAGSRRHLHLHAVRLILLHFTAAGDPVVQQLVRTVALAEASTAFVGHLHQRLGQQKAGGGVERVGASTEFLSRQGEGIEHRIKCAQ